MDCDEPRGTVLFDLVAYESIDVLCYIFVSMKAFIEAQ